MYCEEESCQNIEPKFRCSGCRYTLYCSEQCQQKDWRQHKKGCMIQRELNKFNDRESQKPKPRPRNTHCTGCNVKFTEDYPSEQDCPHCGYTTCESCACHHSRGTCSCKGSNFGSPYCPRVPKHYHAYSGDYHPDARELSYEGIGTEELVKILEPEVRVCNNCGETKRCLKPGMARLFY
ncbi:hypothetical protein BT96DRAFT_851251 [Gymnopus androsaceus JB14]|uniref:MYND-type domain-containing protein n=1 Tax=Gymnopus androsaceus JB14 TaxID=1447944 RepID=A0A6A4I4R5_9AGAR|nr:hypothetical protein BT96DRAFT_851251 [Gymnopus androsaceus JB14]